MLSFEVDEVEPALRSGWSVCVTGQAELVDDDEQAHRLRGRLQAWAPGPRDLFVRIPLAHVSGRRVVPAARIAFPG